MQKCDNFFYLTKPENRGIIIKLSDERTTAHEKEKKFFEKVLKKDLTNETKCGIINEFANEPDGSHRAQE